jgi:hypothetical protein
MLQAVQSPPGAYDTLTSKGYKFRGVTIPDHLCEGLDLHVLHGTATGSFLWAVLTNDLREALARADDTSLAALPAIVGWLYNEAPAGCWGSAEKADRWQHRGGCAGGAHQS